MSGGLTAYSFGLDSRANEVFVSVPVEVERHAQDVADRLTAALGVPFSARSGSEDTPTHCDGRSHCHGPMKAGILIHRGAAYETACTMGFHITRSAGEEFVTAGHCGFGGSNSWYHPAFGAQIGVEAQTLYFDGGQDIMRVTMADSEASDDVYNDSTDIIGQGTPVQGETLCTSLGNSNTVKCGTVTSTWSSINYGPAWGDFDVWGGDMSYSTVKGDSGAPVYRRLSGGTGDRARAVGVSTTTGGRFARLDTSLDDFSATVFQ
jgi:hypothetical protein